MFINANWSELQAACRITVYITPQMPDCWRERKREKKDLTVGSCLLVSNYKWSLFSAAHLSGWVFLSKPSSLHPGPAVGVLAFITAWLARYVCGYFHYREIGFSDARHTRAQHGLRWKCMSEAVLKMWHAFPSPFPMWNRISSRSTTPLYA